MRGFEGKAAFIDRYGALTFGAKPLVIASFAVALAATHSNAADGADAAGPPPSPPPAVVVEEGDDWVACDLSRDIIPGSALDFSTRLDAPAGKHGWLRAVGEHFEFEDLPGVPQRFFGVNVCMGMNVPTHEEADVLVDRIARLGYNSIRIHHHDRRLVSDARNGEFFNAGMIDKFDYLYAAAIRKGLYLTTDMFVSRPVAWRDIGEDRDGDVGMHVFKGLTLFHEGAFANWAEFSRRFLEHVNPYTGRAYRDEPALPLICLVNEGWLCMSWFDIRDMECVRRKYEAWRDRMIAAHGPDFMGRSLATNVLSANCWGDKNAATALFLAECEREAMGRKIDFLRSVGCKALLTTGNHGPNNAPDQRVRADAALDYVDNHSYENHPTFRVPKRWRPPSSGPNFNPALHLDADGTAGVGWTRVAGKPFTVSEWNFCSPAFHRGVAGLRGGAMAALQDWGGVWRFDYGSWAGQISGPVGVPDYFDTVDDPMMTAADRTFANLFLRGDVPIASPRVNMVVDEASLTPDAPGKDGAKEFAIGMRNKDSAWAARVSSGTAEVPGAVNCLLSEWGRQAREASETIAPLEGLGRHPCIDYDRERGRFSVSTEKTCGVFARPGERLRAGALDVAIEKAWATVTATSLDGAPLARSSRILVSHLTDAHGTGCSFEDADGTVCLSLGGPPTLVRDGMAEISLELDAPERCKVYALALDGCRRFEVPAAAQGGRLSFTAAVRGTDGRAVLEYEVTR